MQWTFNHRTKICLQEEEDRAGANGSDRGTNSHSWVIIIALDVLSMKDIWREIAQSIKDLTHKQENLTLFFRNHIERTKERTKERKKRQVSLEKVPPGLRMASGRPWASMRVRVPRVPSQSLQPFPSFCLSHIHSPHGVLSAFAMSHA